MRTRLPDGLLDVVDRFEHCYGLPSSATSRRWIALGGCRRSTDLPAKEPIKQGGDQAQKDRGGHGKVEAEATPLDHDVPRQAAKRQLAEPRPQEPHEQEREAGDDQELLHSDLAHAHPVDGGAAVPTGAAPVVRDTAVVRYLGSVVFVLFSGGTAKQHD